MWLGTTALIFALGGCAFRAMSDGPRLPRRTSGCPYDFRSDMPLGVFCVYRGTASAADGEICADDLVVIWSAHAPRDTSDIRDRSGSTRHVYLGFVGEPVLVLRAVATQRTLARFVEYSLESKQRALRLTGFTTLDPEKQGLFAAMTFTLPSRHEFSRDADACTVAEYNGIFVDVLEEPGPKSRHLELAN